MHSYFKHIPAQLPIKRLDHKRVLITGANGLIASNLVDALMSVAEDNGINVQVYALCRTQHKAEKRFAVYADNAKFHLLIQDVVQPLTDDIIFDYIIHAASSAHPGAFNSTPVDVMKANFLGTMNLLEYSKRNAGTRFLFVSSSEVYGENEEGIEIFHEDTKSVIDFTRFRACYPESKRASETLCACYKKQYDTDVIIVRPAYIYGREIIDDNTRADVYFLRQALHKENIVMYSEGKQIRSYCYVKDCVSGVLFALLSGESGMIYNIGDKNCVVTLREYAQALADAGGVQLIYEPHSAPENVVMLKTSRCVLDTTRLEKLGWKPIYSLVDGLKDTFM